MLRRNKSMAIVMAMCLCLAMLAPIFVVAPASAAAADYTVISVPTVQPDATANLGAVMVDIPLAEAVYGSIVTVSLPSELGLSGYGITTAQVVYSVPSAAGVYIYVPELAKGGEDNAFDGLTAQELFSFTNYPQLGNIIPFASNAFDLKVIANESGAGRFIIYFNGVNMKNYSGDVKVDFVAPSNSGFSTALGTIIGKSSSSGATVTNVKSVKNISGGSGAIDLISIMETAPGTLETGTIKLKILNKGVTWNTAPTAYLGWGFSGLPIVGKTSDEDKIAEFAFTDLNLSEAGKLTLKDGMLSIDETEADFGEVKIKVSGAGTTETEAVVAKYVDYGVTVSGKTVTELVSGKVDQKLGEFYLEEGAPGSLVKGRSIIFTLPDGLEWKTEPSMSNIAIDDGSAVTFDGWKIATDNKEVLSFKVNGVSGTEGAKIRFKDVKIDVKPNFTGPVEIAISGSAGVKGTVKVADAIAGIKFTADKATEIIMGAASQKVADMTITENKAEAIVSDGVYKNIVIGLDTGYKFAKKPVVTVDGDLDIDSTKLQENDTQLKIVIDGESAKASAIKITDVYLTALRYVPEGPVKAKLLAAKDADDKYTGSTALDEVKSDKSAGDVVIANCVTPAEGASAEFKIGSNIYTVNGVAKVMDVAPYIKDNRTYSPMRFIALALGLSDDGIVWDETAKTVTLTKGDTVVVFTVGSTTYTINGEAKTMDVNPEIVDGRTMLPARYVAEAFGATVGWDAATQTVLIQQ